MADYEKAETSSSGGGLRLSQNAIAGLILASVAFIFLIGMLSGFVFRDIKACEPIYKPETGANVGTRQTTTSAPQTQSQSTSTTAGSSGSSSSTVSSSSSTPRTTTTGSSSTNTPYIPTSTSTDPTRTFPTLSTRSTTTPNPSNPLFDNIRLPDFYEPTKYDLKIRVDFDPSARADSTSFEGEVDIYFNLKKQSNQILFHAGPQLKVLYPIITVLATNEEINVVNAEHRPVQNDYYFINLTRVLPVGSYKLSLDFEGNYKSLYGNRGIFAAKYLDDLVERTLVATAFLPNEARRVFPCFDEPNLKAVFDIEIDHPFGTFSRSNADQLSSEIINSTFPGFTPYVKTKFKSTPKMNTASLGWVILPNLYQYEERQTANGIPVRVYAKRFAKNEKLLDHALDVATSSINYLEKKLGSDVFNDLKKIDLIAIADYPYEALESWGVSMFRESSILYSSKKDAPITKQKTALLVAEQMAHLWFGNLVTCSWWDDLWFNKGVSGYLKYKAVDDKFPAWDMLNQFFVEETVPTMWEDGFASSHPLRVKLQTTADIISVLDKITTSKGAAVLRTVESVVGENQFIDGLKNYLNKNKATGNGVISDFYSQFTLPSFMSSTTPERFIASWVEQMNYPIVEISLRRSGGNTIIDFAQDRFLLTVFDEEPTDPLYPSPFKYLWQIPLRCKVGGTFSTVGGEAQHLQGSVDEIEVFLSDRSTQYQKNGRQYTWIKCNRGFEAYYTTSYTKNIFEGFISALRLNHTLAFTAADRANLMHVSYQTAYRGDVTYSTPAALSSYLEFAEKDYIVWKVFMYHINLIAGLLEHRPVFKSLSNFGESIVESLSFDIDFYDQTNNPNKPHKQSLLEASAVDFLCRLQEENCLYKMSELFSKIPELYFEKPNELDNPVSPNIRLSVYKYHLQNTYNYNDWFDIYDLYDIVGDAQEKQTALYSLTATRSTWLLTTYLLDMLKSETQIRKQDFFEILNSVARNPSGRHLAWYFYRHYYDDIVDKFTIVDYEFGQSIKAVSETFADIYFLEEMWDFFQSHPVIGSQEFSRLQAIDITESNLVWIIDKEQDIANNLLGPLKKI